MSLKKRALITGITGQDGAYLTKFLLQKGYEVHGIKRRTSSDNSWRIRELLATISTDEGKNLFMHDGDMTDIASLTNIIGMVQPDEIYNLAAQSHVALSFAMPDYTANVDALGVTHLLEAVRMIGLAHKTRLYQASSSELFGSCVHQTQNENSSFAPRSPYAAAKLYAYWMTNIYREAYNMFICNGILFNHESPLRDESFVTRKITTTLARIYYGSDEILYLGNLNAYRDWGYAPDYVEAIWLMLQQEVPEDFVIATGISHSVKDFVEAACKHINIPLIWEGTGRQERGINAASGKTIVAINERYFRPTDVHYLHGDATKAHTKLGWQPNVTFNQLVQIMMNADLSRTQVVMKQPLNIYQPTHLQERNG